MSAVMHETEALTPQQLNRILERTGAARRVSSLRAEPFPCHGLIADLRLVHVQWSDGQRSTLVAKTPTVHAGSLHVAQMIGMYRREVGFYRDLAAHTPAPLAPCVLADGDDQQFVLLLEYLAQARPGDQLAGLSLPEVRGVLGQIARVHAHWWDSPQLRAQAWLPTVGDEWFIAGMSALYQASWPMVCNNFGKSLPAWARAFGDHFAQPMRQAMTALAREPLTLGHGDLRADNLLFEGGEHQTVILDWQLCDRARPMRDVCYLISQGLPVAVRRQHGEELLGSYAAALRAQGVDYPERELRRDLQQAAIYLLAYGVIATGGVDHRDTRGRRMVLTMLERSIAMLEDYGGVAAAAGASAAFMAP